VHFFIKSTFILDQILNKITKVYLKQVTLGHNVLNGQETIKDLYIH